MSLEVDIPDLSAPGPEAISAGGTLDIESEPSITGEQLTMGGVNPHA